MEFLNKVELIGIVGNISVQQYGENKVTRLSLATNYAYKNKEGMPVIETTWHNVIANASPKNAGAVHLEKGNAAHITGRIHMHSCVDPYGNDRNIIEIIATSVEKIEDPITCQQEEK